jgi:hypothetical protein
MSTTLLKTQTRLIPEAFIEGGVCFGTGAAVFNVSYVKPAKSGRAGATAPGPKDSVKDASQ